MEHHKNPETFSAFPESALSCRATGSFPLAVTGEAPYRTMVELAREGMFILDAEARIIYANQCLARMLDYQPEDLVGRPVFQFMSEDAADLVKTQLERRRQGLADVYELNLRKKDGAALPGLISATPLVGEGVYLGSVAVFTDISPLKEVEDKLRSGVAFLETITAVPVACDWIAGMILGEEPPADLARFSPHRFCADRGAPCREHYPREK